MTYQIKSYLKFLRHSTNQHGVHSPFVFELLTKCCYLKKKQPQYTILHKHRRELLSSKTIIEVSDFGAGSKVFSSNHRPVSKIAKNAGISKKRQQLLFRLSKYFQPKNSLEFGTSLGLGTIAIALGNPSGTVQTIEGCPNTMEQAKISFRKFQLKNIQTITNKFDTFLNSKDLKSHYDFIYIDGNHNKKRTLDYFHHLIDYTHNESLMIFDDIYWSEEMTEAWNEIIKHPKVSVSIDTFQWGIVFFRKEQVKQHFVLRM